MDGKPTPLTNPWLKQFLNDLKDVCSLSSAVEAETTDLGWHVIFQSPAFFSFKANLLRNHGVDHSVTIEDTLGAGILCDLDCGDGQKCAYVARDRQALTIHRVRKHGWSNIYRRAVVTNQCPWCLRVFGSCQSAQNHVVSKASKGACPTKVSNPLAHRAVVKIPKNLECPFCDEEFPSLDLLHSHIIEHIAEDEALNHVSNSF